MTEAERSAAQLTAQLPDVVIGSLRFWGQWFGKPYDNVHRIVSAEARGDLLQVHFDGGETLIVLEPQGLEASANTFKIARAMSVRWEWFYYGRPKVAANRYFMEFLNRGDEISSTTNVDWYVPNDVGDIDAAAVEIPP
jgi:hypothetical protein